VHVFTLECLEDESERESFLGSRAEVEGRLVRPRALGAGRRLVSAAPPLLTRRGRRPLPAFLPTFSRLVPVVLVVAGLMA